MTQSDSANILVSKEKIKYFLTAIFLSNIVTMLNTSTVTISIPTYMKVFHVDVNTVQWVVIGYLLPLGMAMPLAEFLGERFSYRKVYLISLAMMGICSLGCALSINFWMLVFFRFLKGISGGIIIPTTMTLLYRYAPKSKQAEYLGNCMIFQSIGVLFGPIVAGFILQMSSWHILFMFNIPLSAIVYWAAKKSIPSEPPNEHVEKIDFLGCGQVALGSGLIMLAFSMGESWGWHSLTFWTCITSGCLLTIFFVVRQFHTSHPLLNFRVLKYRAFAFAMILQCTIALTLGINAILSQFYFQTGRGFSPATTGLILMFPSIMMLLGNMVTKELHKKGLRKSLIIGGLLFALLGNLGLCNLTLESSLIIVVGCFGMRFFGLSLAQMPLTNYGLTAVPRELTGHATSMYNWSKQLVQTISTNILTVLLSMNMTRYYVQAGNPLPMNESSLAYKIAAVEAVNTDYTHIAIFLFLSLILSLFITNKS